MFSAVLGLFSQDLAVDLGTSRTRIHLRSAGVVCDEPSVVAVHTDRRGQRQVMAIGEAALPMLGRTPGDVVTIQPIRDGRIADFEVAEAFLLHLVRRIHGRNGWMRPRMVVSTPHAASDMEVRAIRDSCESAGAREVHLLSRPVAAALGADLPIHEPSGYLVVDVGGGSTEVSVLALSGVVSCDVVPGGGEGMDEAVARWLTRHREILVGRATAEALKRSIGTADPGAPARTDRARGRCMRRGIPRAVEVSSADLAAALAEPIEAIAAQVRTSLEQAPPELASDIVESGVVLTGGGALLCGLDEALRDATGLPVIRAEDPEGAVVRGAGRVLEETELLRAIAC